MFRFLNKHTKSPDPEINQTYVNDIIQFLYGKLKAKKEHISNIKVFYNHDTLSCIVRVKFDDRYVKKMTNEFLYFYINCYQSDITIYGQSLQETLSDNGNYIVWIKENKVLEFYHENNIMNLLNKKLQ